MKNKLCFLTVLLSIITSTTVQSCIVNSNSSFIVNNVKNNTDYSSYRLPENVIPISYDISIYTKLGINEFEYKGQVIVKIKVLEATDRIVLHTDGLIIEQEKTLLYLGPEGIIQFISYTIDSQYYDKEKQFYVIIPAAALQPEEYFLKLHFRGEVRDDVFGFYRSSYVKNGGRKWMGVTQFSPTYARRAFPCMDEPHLKANFTLHIGHFENQTVTSNTQIENVVRYSNNKDYYLTTFSSTPPMSTYLVGWAVHDFILEPSMSSMDFTLWTQESMYGLGTVALNEGLSIYSFLRNLFEVDNPISKMDQIAVADFNFHAMENWGMITYRESVVLFENDSTPLKDMLSGFITMGHEYAHTWFGNLVTPIFWNVAWLKEGFATYFAYFALDSIEPDWKMMDQFVVDVLQPTLLLDAVEEDRVMNGRNVGSPSSIMAVLDFVSYKKGSSVIRMLSHAIGQSVFHSGLQSYLKNMSYGAASPYDLYRYLQIHLDKLNNVSSGIQIKDMMDSWTNQSGFPVVTVIRNYTMQTVSVYQEKFNEKIGKSMGKEEEAKWWIPLNFATKSSIKDFSRTEARQWLRPQDKTLTFGAFPTDDWIIFNVQQVGYYRVNYDNKNWKLLIDYLKSKDFEQINTVNRATLLDDAFNLAKAGHIDYTVPFNLSSYLIQENAYEPWVAATNNFKYLNKMLSNTSDARQLYQEHVTRLIEPIYERLSFNESSFEDLTTKLLRETILSISCSVHYEHCLRSSEALFRNWIQSSNETIPGNLKSFVYCEGIRNGGDEDWFTMWDRLLLTDLQYEQELLIPALGCTAKRNLIEKYLQWSISEEYSFRKQYRITIINSIIDGDARNVEHVLEFLKYNLQKIISLGYDFLTKVIKAIGNAVTAEEQINKLRLFVNENIEKLGTSTSTAKKAINVATANAEWVKKYSTIIAQCLS